MFGFSSFIGLLQLAWVSFQLLLAVITKPINVLSPMPWPSHDAVSETVTPVDTWIEPEMSVLGVPAASLLPLPCHSVATKVLVELRMKSPIKKLGITMPWSTRICKNKTGDHGIAKIGNS